MKKYKVCHREVTFQPHSQIALPVRQSIILDHETRNIGVGYDLNSYALADTAARANLQQRNFRSELHALAASRLMKFRASRPSVPVEASQEDKSGQDGSLADLLLFQMLLAGLCRGLHRRNGSDRASTVKS